MGCCGASRRVGMMPSIAFILGQDDGTPAQYVVVVDGTLIPNVRAGAQRWVKGSGVEAAFADGKIQTVEERQRVVAARGRQRFLVTLPSGRVLRFGVERTARQYAKQSGGTFEVVTQ